MRMPDNTHHLSEKANDGKNWAHYTRDYTLNSSRSGSCKMRFAASIAEQHHLLMQGNKPSVVFQWTGWRSFLSVFFLQSIWKTVLGNNWQRFSSRPRWSNCHSYRVRALEKTQSTDLLLLLLLFLLFLLLLQWRAPNGVLPCRWYVAREQGRWPSSRLSVYRC